MPVVLSAIECLIKRTALMIEESGSSLQVFLALMCILISDCLYSRMIMNTEIQINVNGKQ